MSNKVLTYILISITILTGLVSFVYWFSYDPVKDFKVSLPGTDNRPKQSDLKDSEVIIGEHFRNYNEFKSDLKGKWTNFRGADFDNINKENIPLIDSWKNGIKKVWQVKMGEGHAAPVIYNGLVYILDYDEIKKADALRCFSLETGKEIWKRWYKVHIKRNHGMSRTVPAVNDKYIVSIGPKGHVMCVDRLTGELKWSIDMVKTYGSNIPFWYTGQCPFIENNNVILAPAGSSMIIAVNCDSGEIIWETPNPDKWKMSHSSIIPATYNGVKMYMYAAIGGIVGISAEGKNAGEILWKTKKFSPNVVAPSPVMLKGGKVFMTAGYGAGSILFQLIKNGKKFDIKILQQYKPKDGIACEQQTPIIYKERMFAILPKDAGSLRNRFVCTNPDDGKNILWSSDKSNRFGLGPFIVADGKFYILKDNGELSIAKATTKEFKLLDKTKIINGHDAWGPLAIADGYLLMRDSKNLICLDIKK